MIVENMTIDELRNFVKEHCFKCIKSVAPFKKDEYYSYDENEAGLWINDNDGKPYDMFSDEGYHVWSKAFIKEDE